MSKGIMKKIAAIVIAALTFQSIAVMAQDNDLVNIEGDSGVSLNASIPFDGGTGTTGDPYLISEEYQLRYIPEYTDYAFALTDDITLHQSWNVWAGTNSFNGVLYGNGHTISDIDNTFIRVNTGKIIDVKLDLKYDFQSNLEICSAFVYENKGTISSCAVEGNVSCSDSVSGFAFINDGTIEKSCFVGDVYSEDNMAAGFVYLNDGGSISDSYFIGSVDAIENAAGFVHKNANGTVTNCYSVADVKAPAGSYGFCYRYQDGTVSGCYYQQIEDDKNTGSETSLSEFAMKKQDSYVGWDFDSVWSLDADINDGYPYLRSMVTTEQDPLDFDGGTGTEDDPYLISTEAQLRQIFNDPSATYMLTADIELENGWDYGKNGWNFTGTIYGNGYAIMNLNSVLFNQNFGVIKGVGLWLSNDFESNAAFANYNSGTMERCVALGDITASGLVGGLVKSNTGSIEQSAVAGNIASTNNAAGGFVNYSSGTIKDCYFRGTVSSPTVAAGFIYSATKGSVVNCYSTAEITASSAYGFCAKTINGSIEGCYYEQVDNVESSEYGTPLSSTEIKTQDSFVGWDFENVWGIEKNTDDGYPYIIDILSDEETVNNKKKELNTLSSINGVKIDSFDIYNYSTATGTGNIGLVINAKVETESECVCATYDENGRMIDAKVVDTILYNGDNVVNIEGIKVGIKDTLKIAVWDDIRPLTEALVSSGRD